MCSGTATNCSSCASSTRNPSDNCNCKDGFYED